MALKLYSDTDIQNIANAIRGKNGSSNTYKVSQMASAITAIPTGGVTPTGTKQISITQNGTTTEDVTNYASAEITVNVAGGGGTGGVTQDANGYLVLSPDAGSGGGISIDDIATNTEPSGDIVFNGTTLGRMAFAGKPITSFSGPNVTTIGYNCFGRCEQLARLSLPSLTALNTGLQANDNNTGGLASLEDLYIPNVKTLSSQVLRRCPKLTRIIVPSLTSLSANSFSTSESTLLNVIDIGKNLGSIPNYGFTGSTTKNIILRKDDGIVPCSNVGGLLNPSSGAINYYVPSALISSYQTATNWATRYDAGKAVFIALEGSPYESEDWYLND